MAKVKPKAPKSKTVTLSTGAKITGPESVVDKIAGRDKAVSGKPAPRAQKSADAESDN